MRNSALILFVCAGLLLTGGAILGGSTTWSLIRIMYNFWVTDLGVELAFSILYICGALLCLPTCWLATLVPYQPRSLSLSATLMIVASSAMMALGVGMSSVAALSIALRDDAAVNASLHHAMGSGDPTVQSAFAAMQKELHCCGIDSYSDWFKYRATLPPSCCTTNPKGKSYTSSMYEIPCRHRIVAELRAFINSSTILASVIVVILAVTLFAGAHTLVSSVAERGALASKLPAAAQRLTGFPAPHAPQPARPTQAPHFSHYALPIPAATLANNLNHVSHV